MDTIVLQETASVLDGKRILIVGTGGGASGARMISPVKRTKDLGVEIILLDTDDSSVLKEADIHISADATDYDACYHAVENFVSRSHLDGIVTFVEECTEVTSRLQKDFGFPGHSVWGSNAARDKHKMRETLKANNLPVPQFAYIDNRLAAEELSGWFPFPAFLKPSDGGGSVGTRRIEDSREMVAAYDSALHEITHVVPYDIRRSILASFQEDRPNFLIEEYLAPAERLLVNGFGRVTIELLVQNSKICFFAMADGNCLSESDHRYSTFCFPSALGAVDESKFRDLADKVVSVFELSDGPVIFDAVMTESGPQLYEINARIESSLVLPLVTNSCGVDLVVQTLKIATGIPIGTNLEQAGKAVSLAHYIMAPTASTITRFDIPDWPSAKRDCKITVLKKEGDYVGGPEAAYDCIAAFEFTGPDRETVDRRLMKFLSGMMLELEPTPASNASIVI